MLSSSWTFRAAMLACSSMAASLVLSAQAPLKLVSTAWPPFTNPSPQPRFALDLVEAALGRINRSATTTIVSPGEFTRMLLSREFDGSAAAWKDAERDRVLLFSQPYLENRLVLVGRRDADVSARALADLKGKRVALVEGYSYGEAANTVNPVFVRSTSEEDSLTRLLRGDVDYTLMDELVVQYIVDNYPKESAAKLKIGTVPLITRELYFAVRRSHPEAEQIVAGFNAQLRGMIADRTYHRLLHVKWIRADITGDSVPEYVPIDDRAGPTEPKRIYTLFTSPNVDSLTKETATKPGFYLGGNIYRDWASVPQNYKVSNSDPPDSRRSTASVFKFVW